MMKHFLFGTELSIDEAMQRLVAIVGNEIPGWHGEYWGDYYSTITRDPPHVRIIENAPDPEGYMPEDDFPDPAVLVYVSDPPPEVEAHLLAAPELQLLRLNEH
jgi:hypothetical protein